MSDVNIDEWLLFDLSCICKYVWLFVFDKDFDILEDFVEFTDLVNDFFIDECFVVLLDDNILMLWFRKDLVILVDLVGYIGFVDNFFFNECFGFFWCEYVLLLFIVVWGLLTCRFVG